MADGLATYYGTATARSIERMRAAGSIPVDHPFHIQEWVAVALTTGYARFEAREHGYAIALLLTVRLDETELLPQAAAHRCRYSIAPTPFERVIDVLPVRTLTDGAENRARLRQMLQADAHSGVEQHQQQIFERFEAVRH